MAGDNPDEKPGAFDRTIQGQGKEPGTDETVAAPPARAQKAPQSPFQKTITAPPIASATTVASDSIPPSASTSTNRSASTSKSGARSTVGNEMKGASIERFTPVDANRFELLDELARGGLGRVFRARDPRTGRIVAIKEVLRPQQEIILRFAREALVTANLQHPSIVPVYEVGRWPSGEPFYAMKLVEGRTLDALIAESKTQAQRLALLPHVIDVAEALAYAHGEHVIHRDLKPANVLVGSYGETVVIDWGLAKNLATGEEIEVLPVASTIPPDAGETIAGSVLGTPAYMPPEQAIGDKIDERADVYAIGAILYHALSGVRPFSQAKSLDELLELVAFKSPAPLSQLAPELPPELIAIVEHAMARDPAQRYATAQGIAKDLRDFSAGKLVGAHQYTTRQLIRRWVSQHKAVVATASIALGVLIVVGALGVWRITNERDEAKHQKTIAQTERADAQDARALAEQRFADSLQELARQAVLAGDGARALPLAVGALANRTQLSTALEVIATQALAPYRGLVEVIPTSAFGVSAGLPSPDGTRLYTASGGDESVRAWDAAKHVEVWSVKAGYMLAVSNDGAHVLTANNQGELVVLTAADGKELARYKVAATRADAPTSLAWSADGVHFAAAADTGKLWLGAIGAAPRALPGHTTKINTLDFSTDGAVLASGGEASGVVILHDTATGAERMRITETKGGVWGLAWLDATHLLLGDAKTGRSYDIAARRVVWSLDHGTWVYGFLVAPDGSWILLYGDGATASLWDLHTRTRIADLAGHNAAVQYAVLAGDWIVTGDELGNSFVWDPRSGERVQTLPRDSAVFGLGTAKDKLVVFGEQRQELWQLPARSGAIASLQRREIHGARIRDLAWEDSDVVWTASNDGTVQRTQLSGTSGRAFGTAGYKESIRGAGDLDLSKPSYAHGMRSFTRTPDKSGVVTANEDGSLVMWDVATGQERMRFVGHTGRVRKLVFASDGSTAYSVGDTTVRRWDVATGKELAKAEIGVKGWDVALFPDGTVATLDDTSPGRVLSLWTPALARKPATFEPVYAHELPILDGTLLVSSYSQVYAIDSAGATAWHAPQPQAFTFSTVIDREQRAWSVIGDPRGDIVLRDHAGATVRSWTAADGIVVAVAFSPDGTLVASISDNRVRIWDPQTGALLVATPAFPALLANLAWSADGRRLAIAGSVGTLWVWDVRETPRVPELAAFARCASPWTLADATLVKTPFDPTSCRVLAP